jgi:hypothetical protein
MGLELATYIADLVPTWPLGSDKIRQGDDHLRNIKSALKNTFPNLNGPVTATPESLNALPEDFSLVLAELLKHVVPVGAITAWAGAIAAIPSGWALCNGQTVAGYGDVPDLRDRFIIGAGGTYTPYTSVGASVHTSQNGGNHTPVIQPHTLTTAEMPSHTHTGITVEGSSDDNGYPGPLVLTQSLLPNGTSNLTNAVVAAAGGGGSHTHGADFVPDHTHEVEVTPLSYAFAFIIKVTGYVAP